MARRNSRDKNKVRSGSGDMYTVDQRSGFRVPQKKANIDHHGIVTSKADADDLEADMYPAYRHKRQEVPFTRPEQEDKFLPTNFVPYIQTVLARGTAALTTLPNKLFTYTCTGTSSLVRQTLKALSYTATGTSSVVKAITLSAKSFTATGTSSLATAVTYLKSFSYTATGTASLTTALIYLKSLSFTATGTSSITKAVDFNLSYTATGTSSLATQTTLAATALTHAIHEIIGTNWVERFPKQDNYALMQILR